MSTTGQGRLVWGPRRFGPMLRNLRKGRGLSQTELSDAMNRLSDHLLMNQTRVSEYERGGTWPSFSKLTAMIHVLGLPHVEAQRLRAVWEMDLLQRDGPARAAGRRPKADPPVRYDPTDDTVHLRGPDGWMTWRREEIVARLAGLRSEITNRLGPIVDVAHAPVEREGEWVIVAADHQLATADVMEHTARGTHLADPAVWPNLEAEVGSIGAAVLVGPDGRLLFGAVCDDRMAPNGTHYEMRFG